MLYAFIHKTQCYTYATNDRIDSYRRSTFYETAHAPANGSYPTKLVYVVALLLT